MQCAGAASTLHTPERLCYCERYKPQSGLFSVMVHESTLGISLYLEK